MQHFYHQFHLMLVVMNITKKTLSSLYSPLKGASKPILRVVIILNT